jgi:hypothetical protein
MLIYWGVSIIVALDPDSLLKMIWEDFGGPPGGNHIA